MVMDSSVRRLVWSIQRRWAHEEASAEWDTSLERREAAELAARAQRLRAMGDRFIDVRLSEYVSGPRLEAVCGCVGGSSRQGSCDYP